MSDFKRVSVVVAPSYDLNNPVFKQLAQDFKKYWLSGCEPTLKFGRDTALERPNTIRDAGLAKIHVYSSHLSKKERNAWERKNNSDHPFYRGTSNDILIYAVSEEGTAVLLAYHKSNGHKKMNDYPHLETLRIVAKKIFERRGEQPILFDALRQLYLPTG